MCSSFFYRWGKNTFRKPKEDCPPQKKINIKNYSVNVWQFELFLKMEKTHASEDKCLIPSDVLQRTSACLVHPRSWVDLPCDVEQETLLSWRSLGLHPQLEASWPSPRSQGQPPLPASHNHLEGYWWRPLPTALYLRSSSIPLEPAVQLDFHAATLSFSFSKLNNSSSWKSSFCTPSSFLWLLAEFSLRATRLSFQGTVSPTLYGKAMGTPGTERRMVLSHAWQENVLPGPPAFHHNPGAAAHPGYSPVRDPASLCRGCLGTRTEEPEMITGASLKHKTGSQWISVSSSQAESWLKRESRAVSSSPKRALWSSEPSLSLACKNGTNAGWCHYVHSCLSSITC